MASADPAPPSTRLQAARYTSREWADLERERLWPRVWQIACTEDCVPDAGDHWLYEIDDLSFFVVRGADGEIRAFQNACPHRGNALVTAQFSCETLSFEVPSALVSIVGANDADE